MDARKIQKAADNGNVYAMLSLAYMYQNGIDVECDPESAVHWYKRSASSGCGRAKWELAKMYRDGIIVEANSYEFIHWLTAAADAGIREAQYDLSRRYRLGMLVPKDGYLCIDWLKKAAEEAHHEAAFHLAYAYRDGTGIAKNPELYGIYKEKARQFGDAEAYYDFGKALEFGLAGCRVDLDEAEYWYSLASGMGSDKGLYGLVRVREEKETGKMDTLKDRRSAIFQLPSHTDALKRESYLEEADSLMDAGNFEEAVEKYKLSAEYGNSEAMFMLAMIYHGGEIVRRNDSLAYDYLTRSSICGCADASMQLAASYEHGNGISRNRHEAINCYARAAANGNLIAYYELSRFIEHPERYVRMTQMVVR